MRGQARHDGPNTLMKYSRDWEYPWVLLRSEVLTGQKTLDCGSGYSPIPFMWAEAGAKSHAIDRDAVICSRFSYAVRTLIEIVFDLMKIPFDVLRKVTGGGAGKSIANTGKSRSCDRQDAPDPAGANLATIMKRYLAGLTIKFKYQIKRIWQSDFWGPVSPSLLKRFNVEYRKGTFTKLPYDDNCFDVVSCISILEHMPHPDMISGIKEMARVLKKNGKLIITYDMLAEDLTGGFVEASGMTPIELVYFRKPDDLYPTDEPQPDVVGICLVK